MREDWQPLDPPAVVSPVRFDIKQVFRNGWSHAGRVRGWAGGTIFGEFADPAARQAWTAALRRATLDMPTGDALDMGTGPGTISQLWAEIGWKTSGLDFSPTMLATCAAAARDRGLTIDLNEGDVESPQVTFAARKFAVISSRLVIFTLPRPGLALRRWVQMLRTGGRMVLMGEDHGDRQHKPSEECKKEKKERPPGAWHADEEYKKALGQLDFMHHDSKSLRVVMEAAGLDHVKYVPMNDVVAARQAIVERSPTFRVFRSQPFMLVGEKSSDVPGGR
ncbi:MAG: class I SAM-dependent methyltransferase [Tepidisphaeraceae bacterium]